MDTDQNLHFGIPNPHRIHPPNGLQPSFFALHCLSTPEIAGRVPSGCWRPGSLEFLGRRVAYPLKLIEPLYRREHLANTQELSPDERAALQQKRSQPVFGIAKRWLVATHSSEVYVVNESGTYRS